MSFRNTIRFARWIAHNILGEDIRFTRGRRLTCTIFGGPTPGLPKIEGSSITLWGGQNPRWDVGP